MIAESLMLVVLASKSSAVSFCKSDEFKRVFMEAAHGSGASVIGPHILPEIHGRLAETVNCLAVCMRDGGLSAGLEISSVDANVAQGLGSAREYFRSVAYSILGELYLELLESHEYSRYAKSVEALSTEILHEFQITGSKLRLSQLRLLAYLQEKRALPLLVGSFRDTAELRERQALMESLAILSPDEAHKELWQLRLSGERWEDLTPSFYAGRLEHSKIMRLKGGKE